MSRGIDLQEGVIYKVSSRRLGHSLGINVSGLEKACNYSCCYCQYEDQALEDMSEVAFFPTGKILDEVKIALKKHGGWYDYVTFSGNGESTLHPDFPAIAAGVKKFLEPHERPMAILTNSSTAHIPKIREALNLFDRRFMKLDAGNEQWFKRVNRPAYSIFQQVMQGLLGLDKFTLQTMLFRGGIDGEGNCTEGNIKALIQRYKELAGRIEEIHLYTAERESGSSHVEEVHFEDLKKIAQRVNAKTGVRSIAFYGGDKEIYE